MKLLNHGWCLRERPARSSRGQDCWTRLQCATRASGRRPQTQANGREGVLPESKAGGLHWTGFVKLQVSESNLRVLMPVPRLPSRGRSASQWGGGAEAGAAGPRGRGAEQLAPGLPEHGGGRVLVLLKSRNLAVTILERGSDWATPIYRTDGDLPTMPGSTDFVLQGAGRSRAWRVRRSRQHLARE